MLDFGLLGIDGVMQLRKVLACSGNQRTAVLLMSSSRIGEVMARVAPGAGLGFIQKPFEFGELARMVRTLLPE